MKHIQSKIVVCAMFALAPLCLSAQDNLAANDTLSIENDKEVQVAFQIGRASCRERVSSPV